MRNTLEAAMQRSRQAREEFAPVAVSALTRLENEFRALLSLELETTLAAGASDSAAYIHRPLLEAWNGLGSELIGRQLFWQAEALYRYSIEAALEAEDSGGLCRRGLRLHKGHSYMNMGLSQFLQGNWDEGVQNIRRAVLEDEASGVPQESSHAHLRGTLKLLVEPQQNYVADRVRQQYNANNCAIPAHVIADLFGHLTIDRLLSAAYSIRTARVAGDDTEFGRMRRLNALRDACYLFEVWLRDRGHGGRGLKPCLDHAYGGTRATWWTKTNTLWGQMTSADTTQGAGTTLLSIRSSAPGATADDLLTRAHLQTGLMRNWTHHQFDPSAPFLSDPDYHELFDAVWVCLAHGEATGV